MKCRARLAKDDPNELVRLNHPRTVLRAWGASMRPPPKRQSHAKALDISPARKRAAEADEAAVEELEGAVESLKEEIRGLLESFCQQHTPTGEVRRLVEQIGKAVGWAMPDDEPKTAGRPISLH